MTIEVNNTDQIIKVCRRVDTVFVDIGGLRIQISRDGSDDAPEIGVYAYDEGATSCKANVYFDAPRDGGHRPPSPRYLLRSDNGREDIIEDCVSDDAAIEYAMEILLDDGAEPGEEIAVYRLDGSSEEYVGSASIPDDE